MGLTTIVYTYLGGMSAVIWTDVIQLVIYLSRGRGAWILLDRIPAAGPRSPAWRRSRKFTVFDSR